MVCLFGEVWNRLRTGIFIRLSRKIKIKKYFSQFFLKKTSYIVGTKNNKNRKVKKVIKMKLSKFVKGIQFNKRIENHFYTNFNVINNFGDHGSKNLDLKKIIVIVIVMLIFLKVENNGIIQCNIFF